MVENRLWKMLFSALVMVALASSNACSASTGKIYVTVVNPLDIARPSETVVLDWRVLAKAMPGITADRLSVMDKSSSKETASQVIDLDVDGHADQLLFQWDFKPRESRKFVLKSLLEPHSLEQKSLIYARYVPERMDDFAWENDCVAFRMYGPALRKELHSSGVDVWTKRVRSLVINKWYASGDYHMDHGEGLDCFTVGPSRGCGGTGIWKNNKLYVSDNYDTYKVIANGPIRAIFELSYGPWDADGVKVSEVKRITLDAGQNLSRFDITYACDPKQNAIEFAAGLAKRTGVEFLSDAKDGWMSLWGPADSQKPELQELGIGVVVDKHRFQKFVETGDHAFSIMNAAPGKAVTFYAGFGWTKSGDYLCKKDWLSYLGQFAQRVNTPIRVTISR